MSAAGRSGSAAPPSEFAAALREAGLVRLVAWPDGDALAATGLLGRALSTAGVPFQASVRRVPDPGATEADLTVGVGHATGDRSLTGPAATPTAHAVARELGADPDPVLALAGVVAAGRAPGDGSEGVLETARERGLVERRPGVAVPTPDPAEGLAHSTLLHAPFSGDVDATEAALADLGLDPASGDGEGDVEADRRRLASFAALSTVEGAPPRAAEAVERALHPLATTGPFATVGGYADVLAATAREQPGTGVALALGHGGREAALDAWRTHASAAHAALRDAEVARHRGVAVAHCDGPVETVARLLRDFRSPEPVAVAVGDGVAGVATTDRDAGALAREAATAAGGRGGGRGTTGHAAVDDGEAFVDAVREAV